MATLLIEKNSLNVWTHTPSDFQPYILTQFYAKANGDNFMVYEFSGVQRGSYHYSDISIKDGTNPLENGFVSIKQVMLRLEELKYVGFEFDGDFIAAEVISSDPSNALIEGTDGKLFVPEVSGEVITTNTNITSSNLTTQDVSGFVAYINALVSSFSVAANEIRTYTVTDTGQKFEILLRGRSFGGSEPDILTSDVLELEQSYLKFDESFPVHYYSLSNGNAGYVQQFSAISTDGTTSFTTIGSNYSDLRRLANRIISPGVPGSTSQIRTGIPCGNIGLTNSSIEIFNAIESAAFIPTIRTFSGIRIVSGTSTGIGNIEPSTQVNVVGIGNDSTDANMQIMHNDSTGTCTKIDLGADFPSKYNGGLHIYRVLMHNPIGTSKWIVMVEDMVTGAKISKTITTDVPSQDTQIYPITWANNETTATAVQMMAFGWQVKNN